MEEENGLEPKIKLKLEIAYFIAAHKDLFKRLGFFLLIILNLGLYLYSVYNFINYFLNNKKQEAVIQEMTATTPNYKEYRTRVGPQPLIVLSQSAIPSGEGRYDFVAQVKNPNEHWLAREVNYSFLGLDDKNPVTDFILPKEETFLLFLGKNVRTSPSQAQIYFFDIKWQRVGEPFEIQDSDFKISEARFVSPQEHKISRLSLVPARVAFKARNNTVYDYWDAGFKIVLFQGAKIIGVNFASLSQFRSGEQRDLEVIWLEDIFRPTEIKIEPKIDYLNLENYMSAEFFAGELK